MSIKHLTPFSEEEIKSRINKAIVDDSQIENFINVFHTNNSTCQFTYLEFESLEKEFESLEKKFERDQEIKELAINPFIKYVQVETHQVTVHASQKQIRDLNQYEIDVIQMSKNALISQASHEIYKKYIKRINELADKTYKSTFTPKDKILSFLFRLIKKEYIKKIKVKNIEELLNRIMFEINRLFSKNRFGPADFVICSTYTGALLQYGTQYIMLSQQPTITTLNAIYPIRKFANLIIYVDPNMKFNDNTIIIGRKVKGSEPGLHMVFNDEGTEDEGTEIIQLASNTPIFRIKEVITLKMKYTIVNVGMHPEYNYTKFVYKSKMKI